MNKLYLLSIIFLFTVTVKIPLGPKRVYFDVKRATLSPTGYTYQLILSNGKRVSVPVFWTIVEEQ